jgi:hypothetical protein
MDHDNMDSIYEKSRYYKHEHMKLLFTENF